MTDFAALTALRAALDQYALQGLNSKDDAEFWVSTFLPEQRVQMLIALWKTFDDTTEAAALKAVLDWITPEQLNRVHAYAARKLEKGKE